MKKFKLLFLIIFLGSITQQIRSQSMLANISDPSLDFTLVSLKGDSIRLSSMKGKVFLLDFWASWCIPCRASNKQLVNLYDKYRDKGFEILGVSLDENIKDWKRAIIKDKISWLQVIDTNGWDAVAALKWNIEAIPSSFLIDQLGNVVAINPDKEKLESIVRTLTNLKK